MFPAVYIGIDHRFWGNLRRGEESALFPTSDLPVRLREVQDPTKGSLDADS